VGDLTFTLAGLRVHNMHYDLKVGMLSQLDVHPVLLV